ncbi:hypothetical protein PHLCEN_2v5862 [Hermanssonia centrifuga]|uniref:Mannosyltransferase n=1 Tax=Hermanssonia centrifuga TaxID=98765 RepID=A0A2R6P122_9APHY|nr:hypothetical protein PHLCEN_2v5862 [Hermanssonia centrifuga]
MTANFEERALVPDEFFQSLEVAHHLVFGYGHLTWEWLSPKPIRSILYPALNVPIYWLLKVLRLDGTKLLVGMWQKLQRCQREFKPIICRSGDLRFCMAP